jgi:NAD(P)-dependent dehydrogenase (short-subunit alcohol dehydrogenase family)
MKVDLTGKVAIVTGAGGGIGEAYSGALAQSGASVVVADIDFAAAKAVGERLSDTGAKAFAIRTDITDEAQTDAMVAGAVEQFGGVDILVNNAAYMPPIRTGLLDYPREEWRRMLDVNLSGTLNCIRSTVPAMRRRGGGRIVNQSSIGAFDGGHAYGISKLGVQGMTTWLSVELGPQRINVNCIAPGAISTPAGDRARFPGMLDAMRSATPLKVLGDPEDLCGALLFLVSPASNWVTGQILRVDGGFVKRVC